MKFTSQEKSFPTQTVDFMAWVEVLLSFIILWQRTLFFIVTQKSLYDEDPYVLRNIALATSIKDLKDRKFSSMN